MQKEAMSDVQTAAMWDAAGTSYASQHICCYSYNHFKWRFCASKKKVRSLGSTAIPPIVEDYQFGGKKSLFWYKDLDQLVSQKISNAIFDNRDIATSMCKLDLLGGADHGQGSLRGVTKILIRDASQKIVHKAIYTLAEVVCKKDNADLFNATIAPKLVASLERIIQYKHDATPGFL